MTQARTQPWLWLARARGLSALTLLTAALVLGACGAAGDDRSREGDQRRSSILLTNPAFPSGGSIPARFTCVGENHRPPLQWDSPPDGTGQLALIVRDLDGGPRAAIRWVIVELPPSSRGIVPPAELPPGADELPNQLGTRSYRGPCPPPGGKAHRYAFTLYALSARPRLSLDSLPTEARAAIEQAAQAKSTLIGRYRRP